MIPNEQTIRDFFTDLRKACTEKTEDDVIKIAQRARSGSTVADGFKSSHGLAGVGGGGMRVKVGTKRVFAGYDDDDKPIYTDVDEYDVIPASSVETMALGHGEDDEMHKLATTLFDMLQQGAASGRGVVNTRDRIVAYQTPERPVGQTAPTCKLDGCDQAKAKGKRGLCQNDYDVAVRWERKYGEPIPPGEQLRRVAERNNPKPREHVAPS